MRDVTTKAIYTTRHLFDTLPTPVKIIIYAGIATFLATVMVDLESLNGWWVRYLAIIVGIAANIVAWLLLRLKEEK